ASADQVLHLETCADLATKGEVLALESVLHAFDLFVAAGFFDRDRHQVRETFEKTAIGVAKSMGARIVEIHHADHRSAQVERHAADESKPDLADATGARPRWGGRVHAQQAPAALGHPLHHVAAVAHGLIAGGVVDRSVLGHDPKLTRLSILEQEHATFG